MMWSQVPAASTDVLLQGFEWNHQVENSWVALAGEADQIASSFSLVWLPPSSEGEGGNTVGGSNMGYHPRTWNNQNSCFGTADQLRGLIAALHERGVKVIADIVVNHRAGATGWGDFTADDFGDYGSYQLTGAHICSGDEINTTCTDAHWKGTGTGGADTGENWDGARDLDHGSEYVQQDVVAYLKWLKGEMGYDGWRWDFVKGFGGEYVGLYNKETAPYLSVAEYWDGSYDAVKGWLSATASADAPSEYRSMAFDFPAKYAIFNEGLGKTDWGKMSWQDLDEREWRPAGLIHHGSTRKYAVTFVDNHDTYRDGSKYTGDVLQAYAVLLSSPGIPCMFWPHWRSNRVVIDKMIAVRRAVGLTSESEVRVTQRTSYYESEGVGTAGTLLCRVGRNAPQDPPTGYTVALKGSNWALYTNIGIDLTGLSPARYAAAPAAAQWYSLDGRRLVGGASGLCVRLQGKQASLVRVVAAKM